MLSLILWKIAAQRLWAKSAISCVLIPQQLIFLPCFCVANFWARVHCWHVAQSSIVQVPVRLCETALLCTHVQPCAPAALGPCTYCPSLTVHSVLPLVLHTASISILFSTFKHLSLFSHRSSPAILFRTYSSFTISFDVHRKAGWKLPVSHGQAKDCSACNIT